MMISLLHSVWFSKLVQFFQGQTVFDLADSQDMCNFLETLKKKQNKEELAKRRQAKRRTEVPERPTEAETPIKLKKVEVEIEGKETKHNENIGKYCFTFKNCLYTYFTRFDGGSLSNV